MHHLARALAIVSLLYVACYALPRTSSPVLEDNPVANPAAIVTVGTARFTVLTDRLIRMEWTSDAAFEDSATFSFTNRYLQVPEFTSATKDGVLTVTTKSLVLTYNHANGSPAFSADNLQIQLLGTDGIHTTWNRNLTNSGNLLGTIRTLDGVDGSIQLDCAKQPRADLHCTYGLVSTLGWSVVDDTQRPLFDGAPTFQWIAPRNATASDVDWYFFGHGLNFKLALHEFTQIAGRIPMPPRYAFGIWFSRYWAYSDIEFMELVQEYEVHQVPLDVLVTDMDWHITFYKEWSQGKKDQAGQGIGWTGFTWDENLFPNPQAFLDFCKSKGLHNTLNIHPASGLQPWEQRYPEMAESAGIAPSSQKYVPFVAQNKTLISTLYDIMLAPLQAEGIDFWWLDWQQGEDWIPLAGVNPTFLLNYFFFTYPTQWQDGRRPLLLHRWGGLGNHRYQVGFSGDVAVSWASLAFQPYFTATAANVGFGYWSHDLGGHLNPETPELYTRWIQWGAFSPVFRTHCTKDPNNDRRLWIFPLPYFLHMRQAVLLRYSLLPYIYTASRNAFDTGVAFLRPLYYDFASTAGDASFQHPNEYSFGADIVVCPVTTVINSSTALASNPIWIPPGQWIEWFSGKLWTGPLAQAGRRFAIDDIPVFVRAGAVLPTAPHGTLPPTGGAQLIPATLGLHVFAAAGAQGSTHVYEDDGVTAQYKTTDNVWTEITYIQKSLTELTVEVGAANVDGTVAGFPAQRIFQFTVTGLYDPTSVSINGEAVAYKEFTNSTPSWHYDGDTLSIVVTTGPLPTSQANTLSIVTSSPIDANLTNGFALQVRRASTVKTLLDQSFGKVWQEDYEAVVRAASTGRRISAVPSSAKAELAAFPALFTTAIKQVQSLSGLPAQVQSSAVALLLDALSLSSSSTPPSVLQQHEQSMIKPKLAAIV